MYTIEVLDEGIAYNGEMTHHCESLREAAGLLEELTGLPYSLIRLDLADGNCHPLAYEGAREGRQVTVHRPAAPVEAGGMSCSDSPGAVAPAGGRS